MDYLKQREAERLVGSIQETELWDFNFLVEQAEILRDSGFNNEAYHTYYDALEMANGKGMDDECAKIQIELAKV